MKRLFTLIVLLGLLGVFAGCSDSNKTGDTPSPGPGTNPPAAGTNAAK